MKFYVIDYENGATRYREFNNYNDAMNYAEGSNGGYDFLISEYDSEEDYENTL